MLVDGEINLKGALEHTVAHMKWVKNAFIRPTFVKTRVNIISYTYKKV
jgi:hypothetical protein